MITTVTYKMLYKKQTYKTWVMNQMIILSRLICKGIRLKKNLIKYFDSFSLTKKQLTDNYIDIENIVLKYIKIMNILILKD